MVTTTDNQAQLIKNYFEVVWGKKDLSRCTEFINDQALFRSPLGEVQGIDQIKQHFTGFLDNVKDLKVEIVDLVVQDNQVACRAKVSGKCGESFFGVPANGSQVHYDFATFFKLENGKIQEMWVLYDAFTVLKQIGAIDLNISRPR